MDGKRHAMAVAALCCLGCLVQSLLICRATLPSLDAVHFVQLAQAIDQEGLLPALRAQRDQPLFPVWVWLVHASVERVAGDFRSAWAVSVQLAAAIPLVLLVVPVYFLSTRLWGPSAGWFAGLLLCLLPEVARLGADGLSDSSHLLVFALAIWGVVAAAEALGSRIEGLWMLLAGVATGLAVLVRIEALVLPVAVGVTAAWLQMSRRWRRPWRPLAAGMGCFALGTGLTIGPYLGAVGSLAPRDAIDRLLGRYDAERDTGRSPAEKAAAGWQLADGQPMSFASKDPSTSIRKRGYAAAVGKFGRGLAAAFGYGIGLLGLVGLWRHRGPTRPAGRFLAVFWVLFSLVAVHFAATEGYLRPRHVLVLAVSGIGLCGLGTADLGLLLPRWRPPAAWTAVALAGLALVAANVAPLHASRVGHQQAARWLALEAPEPGIVIDTRGWTGLYSGRPTSTYQDAPQVLADPRLAYVVVEQEELDHNSARAQTLRMLLAAAGHPAAYFPQQQTLPPGWATVAVYRWHPDRFRQWVDGRPAAVSSNEDRYARACPGVCRNGG
jgi:hypothetical protein